jgi:NADH-quinone oxidoreductase subunit C
MLEKLDQLAQNNIFALKIKQDLGEINVEVSLKDYYLFMQHMLAKDEFHFEQLIDLCGVDYSEYNDYIGPKYAVVVHLLSIKHNQRIRVKVFLEDEMPILPSISNIWSSSNWYEREAFDLFGILFEGHNDLRRILTDYGFIGHPMRKEFPTSGFVEMKYDEQQERVVYQPITIEERSITPKIHREQNYGN